MLILVFLNLYFDAVVVFVTSQPDTFIQIGSGHTLGTSSISRHFQREGFAYILAKIEGEGGGSGPPTPSVPTALVMATTASSRAILFIPFVLRLFYFFLKHDSFCNVCSMCLNYIHLVVFRQRCAMSFSHKLMEFPANLLILRTCFKCKQKYSRLRCSLCVKGLEICSNLGWSGSILRFRKI